MDTSPRKAAEGKLTPRRGTTTTSFAVDRPLGGKPGATIRPGSQYWSPLTNHNGPHWDEAPMSSTMAAFRRHPESARNYERRKPFTDVEFSKTAGFGATVVRADWYKHPGQDTAAMSRTTYKENVGPGSWSPRARFPPASPRGRSSGFDVNLHGTF
mmetsp:Transcript_46637/g.110903  ORF Transcript_46637/g.110903 Transcript_46637/m.110903 type:complete len:156 (-) Transcript_46637:32-499(-)